jgi:TetR/AcrR family transcriptional regulator, cholesterol catabolism regulator
MFIEPLHSNPQVEVSSILSSLGLERNRSGRPGASERGICAELTGRAAPTDRVGVTSIERGTVAKNAEPRTGQREVSPPSSRSKRQEILTTAIEHFGRNGYEYTKWADIAADVGLGSTALYHYFESKLHCLFEIHAEALEAECERFERLTADRGDFAPTLVRVLNGLFDLTELEVLRNRVLVAEEGLIAVPRKSPREEEARRLARARMRDIEFAWASFLTRGMEQGAIPEADPRLLTHALLGLYKSVWHWYRPGGNLSLDDIRGFFVERCLAVAGCGDAPSVPAQPAGKPRTARKAA